MPDGSGNGGGNSLGWNVINSWGPAGVLGAIAYLLVGNLIDDAKSLRKELTETRQANTTAVEKVAIEIRAAKDSHSDDQRKLSESVDRNTRATEQQSKVTSELAEQIRKLKPPS